MTTLHSLSTTGFTEPREVAELLHAGSRAFLAGDYALCRRVFETALSAVADAKGDAEQRSMVAELASLDVKTLAAQYLLSVFWTTGLAERAEVFYLALSRAHRIAFLRRPLLEMQDVAGKRLGELDAFLPRWFEYLDEETTGAVEDRAHDAWLMEAALRSGGVEALGRVARRRRSSEVWWSYCCGLAGDENWGELQRASDEALAEGSTYRFRGELLDGAALAAVRLGCRDAASRAEKAWREAPTTERAARWLSVGNPAAVSIARRARKALAWLPDRDTQQRALLLLGAQELTMAAELLERAPGHDWWREEHPGQLLFGVFAEALSHESRRVGAAVSEWLVDCRLEGFGVDHEQPDSSLAFETPSPYSLFVNANGTAHLEREEQIQFFESMLVAAKCRVETVLSEGPHRSYFHAASLIACCVALAPLLARKDAAMAWFQELADTWQDEDRFSADVNEWLSAFRVEGDAFF